MKKLAIILFIFLSLFIVSCAQPDNDPAAKEPKEIKIVIGTDLFPEKIRKAIAKIEFSYEVSPASKAFSKPVILDVPEDGKVGIKIQSKKGDRVDLKVKALDKNMKELAKKSGSITPKQNEDQIVLGSERIVLKIRNSDLPKGAKKINVDAFGDVGPVFNPSITIDVAEGEFTIVPTTEGFDKIFKSDDRIQFCITGAMEGGKDEPLVAYLSYIIGQSEYVVEKPKPIDITIKMHKPKYSEPVVSYSWVSGEHSGTFTEFPGNEVIASFEMRPDYYCYFTFKALGTGEKVIAEHMYYIPVSGLTSFNDYIDAPIQDVARTISIKPGSYMDKVDEYALILNPDGGSSRKYYNVKTAASGNTILSADERLEFGTEYEVQVLNKSTNGGPYVIAKYRGKLAIPTDDSDIVLEPLTPYGRLSLEFDVPFWSFSCSYKVKEFNKNLITRRWDALGPEYVYLPAGNYELEEVSCTGIGNTQNEKIINVEGKKTFTIETGKEIVIKTTIGDENSRRDVRFILEGGTQYRVNFHFTSKWDGMEWFYYDLNSDTFTLPNIPLNADYVEITAETGATSKTKTFNKTDLENNLIVWNFITESREW